MDRIYCHHTTNPIQLRKLCQRCRREDASEEMYGALQLWSQHNKGTRGHYCSECAEAIEKALAKMEGK